MILESLPILSAGSFLIGGEIYVTNQTRDPFRTCACEHLIGRKIACPRAIPEVPPADEEAPAPRRVIFKSFHWERRLVEAHLCSLVCKHNPFCKKVIHIPEFVTLPGPAGWTLDPDGKYWRSPDNAKSTMAEIIKNPDFTDVAYGTRAPASSEEKPRRKKDTAA